jgi:hypothetical protein
MAYLPKLHNNRPYAVMGEKNTPSRSRISAKPANIFPGAGFRARQTYIYVGFVAGCRSICIPCKAWVGREKSGAKELSARPFRAHRRRAPPQIPAASALLVA